MTKSEEEENGKNKGKPRTGRCALMQAMTATVIDTRVALALSRLARRYAVTQQALIERLVLAEDKRILAGIKLDSAQWRAYFVDPSLRSNDGDQIHGKGENMASS